MDLTRFADGRWRELLPLLPQDRQARVLSYRFEADRIRSAGSGWLLQQVLEQAGIPPEAQVFSTNSFGKPELAHRADVHFSLSHSGSWAVCALSAQPVGVDVELPRCSIAVARRHFHPEELAQATDADALCRLWTAKEAFVKALGRGLTIPLNSFRVQLEPLTLIQDYTSLPLQLHSYRLPPCRVTLCTTDPRPELTIVTKVCSK